jgi:hypothetical protein
MQYTLTCHSERSEESSDASAGEHPAGFFASLRMTRDSQSSDFFAFFATLV